MNGLGILITLVVIIAIIIIINTISLICVAKNRFEDKTGLKKTAIATGHTKNDFFASKNLPETIGKIIKICLSLLGVIFLLLIIYGGYIWMLAQGNDQEVEKAIKIIKNSIIGLVIISAAYIIVNLIFEKILSSGLGL